VHQAPSVRIDPGLTLSSIQSVRAKLHSGRWCPHAIDSRSTLIRWSLLRAYKPAVGHTALCLTFVTGAGNVYCADHGDGLDVGPDRAASHDFTSTLRGRRFDLYNDRGNIHMIVLAGAGRLLGVNTCRRALERDDAAIAKGLLPSESRLLAWRRSQCWRRYVGLVTRRMLRRPRHEVVSATSCPSGSSGCRQARWPIYEPGLELGARAQQGRIRFTLDIVEAVDGADSSTSPSGRRRRRPATPISPRSGR